MRDAGNSPTDSPRFEPLQTVPETGIYSVYHGAHRATHEVTLVKGAAFPVCKRCGDEVRFELLRSTPMADDRRFRFNLYELPHPEEAEDDSQVA